MQQPPRTEFGVGPPPPLRVRDYVRPAVESSLLAGAGYGAGYLAGGIATYAVARSPKVQARMAAKSVQAGAKTLSNISHVAGTLSSLVMSGQHLVAESMRREQLWNTWAKQQQHGKTASALPLPALTAMRQVLQGER